MQMSKLEKKYLEKFLTNKELCPFCDHQNDIEEFCYDNADAYGCSNCSREWLHYHNGTVDFDNNVLTKGIEDNPKKALELFLKLMSKEWNEKTLNEKYHLITPQNEYIEVENELMEG